MTSLPYLIKNHMIFIILNKHAIQRKIKHVLLKVILDQLQLRIQVSQWNKSH